MQGDDRGNDIQRLQPRLEFLHFAVDDAFRLLRFLLSIRYMRRDYLLQIVDVINEDPVQSVHLGIHIAWDRYIDEEHGLVFPAVDYLFCQTLGDDEMRGAGRCDHNVRARFQCLSNGLCAKIGTGRDQRTQDFRYGFPGLEVREQI